MAILGCLSCVLVGGISSETLAHLARWGGDFQGVWAEASSGDPAGALRSLEGISGSEPLKDWQRARLYFIPSEPRDSPCRWLLLVPTLPNRSSPCCALDLHKFLILWFRLCPLPTFPHPQSLVPTIPLFASTI